jgi:hypothetical protein
VEEWVSKEVGGWRRNWELGRFVYLLRGGGTLWGGRAAAVSSDGHEGRDRAIGTGTV